VSRWSAERLRIGLAPDRVELARLGHWPGRPPVRQAAAGCTPRPGEPPWQAALAALDQALTEFKPAAGAAAVVLSNHCVRYAVLPWQPEATHAAEMLQLARLHFERTYGAATSGWTVRICDGGYGEPQVACAVDTPLIDGLRQCLAAHGLRLGSLQPLVMAAFNDLRRGFSGRTAFAIVESGRICLSLLDPQRWLDIASRRTWDDPAEAIEQELASRCADSPPPRLDVLLVGPDVAWTASEGRLPRRPGPPQGPGRVSLALCGAG